LVAKKKINRRENVMKPKDIRVKNKNYEARLAGEPPSGLTVCLYGEVLDKIGLDPKKLKIGDTFNASVSFIIENLSANSANIEITHMGMEEPEQKEKSFMSNRL
jgi:hypothetical protein